jgi:hypothetical protein
VETTEIVEVYPDRKKKEQKYILREKKENIYDISSQKLEKRYISVILVNIITDGRRVGDAGEVEDSSESDDRLG